MPHVKLYDILWGTMERQVRVLTRRQTTARCRVIFTCNKYSIQKAYIQNTPGASPAPLWCSGSWAARGLVVVGSSSGVLWGKHSVTSTEF